MNGNNVKTSSLFIKITQLKQNLLENENEDMPRIEHHVTN